MLEALTPGLLPSASCLTLFSPYALATYALTLFISSKYWLQVTKRQSWKAFISLDNLEAVLFRLR